MPHMSDKRKAYGSDGERHIQEYLKEKGYTICTSNFTIRGGEIDIIARLGDVYAFVEVKNRKVSPKFELSLIITPQKQFHIIRTARHYLASRSLSFDDYIIRFDVAFVCDSSINYIENAFTASQVF